jgi:hypothetical protein
MATIATVIITSMSVNPRSSAWRCDIFVTFLTSQSQDIKKTNEQKPAADRRPDQLDEWFCRLAGAPRDAAVKN